MKFIITALAALFTVTTQADPGGTRRCVTTEHMKSVRLKNAIAHPNVNSINTVTPNYNYNPNVIFYIPVVVHVLWNTSGQNISDAQIQSQMDVLNEDYSRTNPDAANTPGAFSGVASTTNFRFCLATVDPNGNPTTGIQRRQTTLTEFQTDDKMKFTSMGGLNAWDTERYLNIWVCNMADDILGYAETPDIIPHTNTFGVVIAYNAFGRTGTATSPYNLGRTATHEVGHCFNLWHVWGDDNGQCGNFGDDVADTPDQSGETFNCENFPVLDTCSNTYPGIMFMNYMDYSDDACMNIFTAGQATRMYNEINNYYPTLLASSGCGNVGVEEMENDNWFSIYPNPAKDVLYVDFSGINFSGENSTVLVMNAIGKTMQQTSLKVSSGMKHRLDLSQFAKGVYFITVKNERHNSTKRIIIN